MKNLKYLEGLVQETLRFYGYLNKLIKLRPAAGLFTRIAKEDHKLDKYHIKKGTIINVGIKMMNFNPSVFKDPLKF